MNPPHRPDDEQPTSRDPLLDDPAFAEILAGRTPPEPAPKADREGAPAEDAEARAESEPPIAEVIEEPPPLPTARPIAPPATPVPPRASGAPNPPAQFRRPDSGPPPPAPRPRVYAACCVIGCLGVALLAAVGFLAFVAIVVLERLGDQLGEQERNPAGFRAPEERPGPVTKTAMKERRKSIPLRAPFDAVGRGAAGRFLILRIPNVRQLALFDPNTIIVRELDLEEPNSFFAGGASKLYVYKPKDRQIERWNLVTLQREDVKEVPRSVATATAMTVGAATDGPVFLFSSDSRGNVVTIIDEQTLTEKGSQRLPQLGNSDIVDVRSSDDGSVLGVAADSGSLVLTVKGIEFDWTRPLHDGKPVERAIPSPDGRFVYTPRGIYSTADKKFLTRPGDYFFTLPTDEGSGLYLSLDVDGDRGARFFGSPRLHLAGSTDPVATLQQVRLSGMWATDKTEVSPDQRVHLWPAAGLVAYLPSAGSKIIEVEKVDVHDLLKQSGSDYLLFGSAPPTSAVVGREWRYRPEVWSSGNPRIRLDEAPVGMKLNRQEMTWTPDAAGTFDVKIEASDAASKQAAEQRFRIVVTEPEAE